MLLLIAMPSSFSAPDDLKSTAEKSGWKKTARFAEAEDLCRRFERAFPKYTRCVRFGQSPEGRSLLALEVSAPGTPTNAPWILIQAGIHAGEIEGKDAGFLFLRQLLKSESSDLKISWLQGLKIAFIPVFNVDGHERFGPNHRPNQNGPEEMGWRVTSQNLNLNRDHMKIDAPEMRALLQYAIPKNPILVIDLHTTDGAQFRPVAGVIVEPGPKAAGENEALRAAGLQLKQSVVEALNQKGHLALPYYPEFIEEDNPASGVEIVPSQPRLSYAYWALRRRIGAMIETHSYKPYATRVAATRDALAAFIAQAYDQARTWEKLSAQALAEEEAKLAGTKVTLEYERAGSPREINFAGYVYDRKTSSISGKMRITYDPSKPQDWKIPLYEETQPMRTATAPKKGYLIPPSHADWAIPRLKLHGVRFEVFKNPENQVYVETFRAKKLEFSQKPYEGRTRITRIDGGWELETRTVPAGSLWIPIKQPHARLAMHLLEPHAPDSWLSWGFFNSAYEQKEYMEAYLIEAVAERLMKEQPFLKTEFEAKLAAEPEFAKSPEKRLEFFYRKHPSWDDRVGLYPVFRK